MSERLAAMWLLQRLICRAMEDKQQVILGAKMTCAATHRINRCRSASIQCTAAVRLTQDGFGIGDLLCNASLQLSILQHWVSHLLWAQSHVMRALKRQLTSSRTSKNVMIAIVRCLCYTVALNGLWRCKYPPQRHGLVY